MRYQSALTAAIVLGAGILQATPAAAVVETFATYSAATSARNVRFVNVGNSASRTRDATMYTTSTGTSNVPGAAAVKFSFLIPSLSTFVTGVDALYTLNVDVAKNSAVNASGVFVQGGLTGSFSFITTQAITLTGPLFETVTFAAGSNLLSGVFTAGNLIGNIGSSAGSSFASGVNGGTITFTSDFLDFTDVLNLDRAQSLTAVSPLFSRHAGANNALSSFRAVAGGQFSSDPLPTVNFLRPVPEPETWAMMLVGFGLIGFAARRRSIATA